MVSTVCLQPGQANSILRATQSNSDNSLAIYSSATTPAPNPIIYFATHHSQNALHSSRKQLTASTYLTFINLQVTYRYYLLAASYTNRPSNHQTITNDASSHVLLQDLSSPDHIQYLHRILQLYLTAISAHLTAAQNDPQEQSHSFDMMGILLLANILYFPADGRGEGIVGEEIMDWVNRGTSSCPIRRSYSG